MRRRLGFLVFNRTIAKDEKIPGLGRRIAAEEGRSQAEVVRAALSAYERARAVPRVFALEGSWQGDGSSVADVPEEELLAGFGG